jgi:hypothetical protein
MKTLATLSSLQRTASLAALAAATWLPGAWAETADATCHSQATAKAAAPQASSAACAKAAQSECPLCKDKVVTVVETTGKGPKGQTLHSVVKHTCPSCADTLTTVGQGKAKTDVATHTCKAQADGQRSCCLKNAVAAAPKATGEAR